MALREIRIDGDPILRKISREVTDVNNRILTLLDDMLETMKYAEGVGLAAPQVGVLRRAIVVDVGEESIKLINPAVIEKSGENIDIEGCLSIPLKSGKVKRPEWVKVKYLDVDGNENIIEATGILARVLCHEIDHLDGILYTDLAIETYDDDDEYYEEDRKDTEE